MRADLVQPPGSSTRRLSYCRRYHKHLHKSPSRFTMTAAAVCTVGPKVMFRKGRRAELAAKAKAASGFDYPATPVGTSIWKGSDGNPVTVYYDPATGASGLAIAQYVLSKIEDVMNSCDAWFGVKGSGHHRLGDVGQLGAGVVAQARRR